MDFETEKIMRAYFNECASSHVIRESEEEKSESMSFKDILLADNGIKIKNIVFSIDSKQFKLPFNYTCNGNKIDKEGKIGAGNDLYVLTLLNCRMQIDRKDSTADVLFDELDENIAKMLVAFTDEYVAKPENLFDF